jgi:hypothetical protein
MFPLSPYLAGIVVFHSIVISFWWPGHCYGSRYFTDMTPLFLLFLIPPLQLWTKMSGLRRKATAAAFVVLAAWGVFTHARGATSVAAVGWSATPVDVDSAPSRVWDWTDPQFLRGL